MPIFPSFFVNKTGGYEIEQSLRFNNGDSAHLHRTPSSAGSQTTFTLSVWVKSSVPSSGAEYFYATHNGSRWNGILRRSGNYDFGVDESGASAPKVVTNAKLRDPSAWYHLVMAYDTTQATSTDRVKIWINGELQSINTSAGSYPNLNHGSTFNRAAKHWIGALDDTVSVYYTKDFYLAEYHLLDGTAVTDAEDFGEYDDNGVWRPIEYTGGNYGTVGFYLKFDPTATNGIGHDHSGNGNNFTATGFTTSGTGTDVMSDTPTTNWCVMNPNDNGTSNITLSNGNLSFAAVTTWDRGVKGTFAVSSGKWYWEYTHGTIVSSSQPGADLGITKYTSIINSHPNGGATSTDSYILAAHDGELHNGSYTGSSYGSAAASGDVISIALDLDNGRIWWAKNGTWFNSGNPASGTNAGYTGLSGTFFPLWYWGISPGTGGVNLAPGFNFGQFDFEYTPPTDFLPLNTSNLPAPDIADGSEYFNTVLYTGTGSYPRAVTGVGFSPDWVWIKVRNTDYGHATYDRVRGVGTSATALRIDNTGGEGNAAIGPYVDMDSLDSDGFTLGNTVTQFDILNQSPRPYVAWNWKADNTSGSSNTDGSITSTVSANPTAGFSIVSYTGNATSGETVGHGLGIKPKWLIVRQRDNTSHWAVYTETEGAGRHLLLNSTNAAANSSAGYYFTAEPTSTVFTVGSNGNVNANGGDMLAYCFAEIEGYSKFGSYTGNGSSDGPFVATSFLPAWIMTKNSSTGGAGYDWYIFDSERNTYNPVGVRVKANASDAETSTTAIDLLSNGFKIRTSDSSWNRSGDTFVYMCFASNPFGGSGVSPATAR